MIPLLHDFTDETVLVFGGGPVGARKARRFATEGRVLVVSPEFADREFGDAELIRAAPDPNDVESWVDRVSPALVVAATSNEAVNEAATTAASERSVLVNRADRAGSRDVGSVVVPATINEDPVVVAIATGGQAPALSKYLRQELEADLEGAGEMATVLAEVRTALKAQDVEPSHRRKIVRDLVNSPDVWTTLRTGTSNVGQVIEDVLDAEQLRGETP